LKGTVGIQIGKYAVLRQIGSQRYWRIRAPQCCCVYTSDPCTTLTFATIIYLIAAPLGDLFESI